MGILTRKQSEQFVISSDHANPQATNKRAGRMDAAYQVWTGNTWSADNGAALMFESLEIADEYVRANYSKLANGI
jgi:hypothetical protein